MNWVFEKLKSSLALRAILGSIVITIVSFSPILIAIGAGYIGSLFGCNINEAGTDPCIINGVPIGGTLSGISVLGWFSLITVPLGFLVNFGWISYNLFLALKRLRAIIQNKNKTP